MKVLVIGSGGYMGRHLMKELVFEQCDAVGASTTDGTGIDPTTGLLPENFSIPPGTQVVVYMAQSPYFRHVPEQASHVMAVNTISAVRCAVAARAAGVSRYIYISTGTVYAPSFAPLTENALVRRDNWYVLSKLHGEEALSLFRQDMEVIVVRPFGVYGPEQRGRLIPNLIESIKAGKPVSLQSRVDDPDDREGLKISLCHVDDATKILHFLVRHGGPQCLNLAGTEVLSVRSMATAISGVLNCEPVFQVVLNSRDTDLIADTRRLCETVKISFTNFHTGLISMMTGSEGLSC